jgi:hypothetical protein
MSGSPQARLRQLPQGGHRYSWDPPRPTSPFLGGQQLGGAAAIDHESRFSWEFRDLLQPNRENAQASGGTIRVLFVKNTIFGADAFH